MKCTCQITAFGKVLTPGCPECNLTEVEVKDDQSIYTEAARRYFEKYELESLWWVLVHPNFDRGSKVITPFVADAGGGHGPLTGRSLSGVLRSVMHSVDVFAQDGGSRYFLCYGELIVKELKSAADCGADAQEKLLRDCKW